MYLSENMATQMESRLDGAPPTASMKKVAKWIANQKNLDLPMDVLQSFAETRSFLDQHWQATTGKSPHPLDRFISIVEAMSATHFKKTSHDYEILDGKAKNTYEALKLARVEQVRQAATQPLALIPDGIKARLVQTNRQAQAQNQIHQFKKRHARKQKRTTMRI